MKTWTYKYQFTEVVYDTFTCEAETEEEAEEMFDNETQHLYDVEINAFYSSDYVEPDPNQLWLPMPQ